MKRIFKRNSTFLKEMECAGDGCGLKDIRSQKGFTLIEIIVTLVLVGILAALGGMGIVQAVKGYITVKENSAITQKAQLAMSRINREIVEMIRITSPGANATVIPLTTPTGEKMIGLDNSAIKIAFDGATLSTGDILIDNVENLTFTYYQGSTESTTWAVGNDRALSGVKVFLEIRHPQGQTLTFGGPLIYPRNNGNLGGEVVSGVSSEDIDPSWPTDIRVCFVATAAYGDAGHPMVQVLRDFRDKYLLSFEAGRWFVKKYYQYGPAAAQIIENRPVAMWAVRCLLAPFVAFAFCLMYAPLAMIFIFFVSMILTAAVFSFYRRDFKWNPGVFRARGSILIGLIFTMVIVAVLAAAMLPMFSSSYMNQVYTDLGRKAYFLAESGFTYAQYQFFEANTETAKEAVIADMNDKTYAFTNGNSFKFDIYPYWFKTRATAVGETTLVTDSLGFFPFSSLSDGNIRVGNAANGYKYYYYSSASAGSLTFNGLSPAIATAVTSGMDVQPVALSDNGNSTTVGNGDTITISSTGAGAFPEFNGTFTFDVDQTPSGIPAGTAFRYERRTGNVLQNVTLADARRTWINFTVDNGTRLVLDKFLIVHSTGTVGGATRHVTYHVPLGMMSGGVFRKVEDLDKNMEHFFTDADKSIGTHTSSDGKMAVTDVVDPYAIRSGGLLYRWVAGVFKAFLYAVGALEYQGMWGIVGYDWSNTNVNLAQSWLDTHGSLSYDVQVKMNNTLRYFMTGIGFKLRSNANETDAYGYGVSVMRQRERRLQYYDLLWGWQWALLDPSFSRNDGIHPDLRPFTAYGDDYSYGNEFWDLAVKYRYVYRYSEPAIILWQRNGPANSEGNFKLLAYRTIQAGDGLTYCDSGSASCAMNGSDLRLKPWVTLMTRVIEGYELPFTSGRVDSFGRHFKYGDTIMNSTSTKTARIVGTPVMSAVWGAAGSSTSVGKLMLTNVTGGGFSSGEQLYIMGGDGTAYATTSAAQDATKTNYILVYYSDTASGSGDAVQANTTRVGNPVYTTETSANWPPDDWTDRAAANDYFTLVQWHYVTPGSNQVSAPASWTLGSGWSVSGSDLSRIHSLGPSIGPSLSSGWTCGNYWHNSGSLYRNYPTWGESSTASYSLTTTPSTQYFVTITVNKDGGTGSLSYTFGGVSGGGISTDGTYGPTAFTPGTSPTAIVISANSFWWGSIDAFTVRPAYPPGTATIPLSPLTPGTTFTVSFTVSGLDSGESLAYTIGGNSATITSNGVHSATYTLPWDGASAGNIVFSSSSGINHLFSISSISVVPSVLNGTLVTSTDSQGNVASYVPAHGSTDFYQAVVKTGALVSPEWSSGATYQTFLDGGDSIALVTSSSAPNEGATTFYDDFAVQLDMKAGVGFMPPIQY